MTHDTEPTDRHGADALALLRRHQPEPDLRAEWSDADQERVLTQILADAPPDCQRRGRSRWVTLGLVATAAAAVPLVASIGLPSSSPGGPTPAAALDRLATIAGVSGPVVGPGEYLHSRAVTDVPYLPGYPLAPGQVRHGDRLRSAEETWSGQNVVWVRSSEADDRPCLDVVHLRGQVDSGGYDTASADQLATLPTDPDALARYLDDHPDGGNTGTINRYAAATDLLWSGIARPALRSAALNVLAQTSGLDGDEHATDDRGRPAIRIDYSRGADVESFWFDPATAQISERAGTTQGGEGSTVVTSRDVVQQLPDLPTCS